MARAAAAEGRHRELSRRPGRGAGRGQQPGGPVGRARGRCRSRASCTSSRTTSARTRRRSSSASRPAARCGCGTRTSSRAPSVVKDAAGQRRRAALHLRPGHARRRRAGRPQGEGDDPLGLGRARGRRRGAAVRPPVHEARTRTTRRRRGLPGEPEPEVARGADGLQARAVARRRRRPARTFQFERLGYFCVDPDSTPERRCSTAR